MLPGSSTLDPDSDLREFGSKNVKEKKKSPTILQAEIFIEASSRVEDDKLSA